jgi:hypothetical protein
MIRKRGDLFAILALIALWLLFFWRLFTPVAADQASLTHGDFSGQFVAFAGYQYARFAEGQIPLWNPYNNGGFPFIADTQAAVFYPPRLVTIALSSLSGGWSYHALELEMTAHVLFVTLTMFLLIRRMAGGQAGSSFGAFVAAVIVGYGGFTSGYPPLQLAILEAAVWLSLAVLGVFEATKPTGEDVSERTRDDKKERTRQASSLHGRWGGWGMWTRYTASILSGFALGMSWLAGHPQTSYFLTLLIIAYLAYRCHAARLSWRYFVVVLVIIGALSFGLVAVQMLPGIEYLSRTARLDFTYDAKGNGFPLQDVLQFLYPGVVSLFSPLYVGVTGFVLALIGVWLGSRKISRKDGGMSAQEARFWGVVALLALLWSLGANSALYPLLYNLLPGLRFFRGQERAAYLVASSLAILAGLSAARLSQWDAVRDYTAALRLRLWLRGLFVACLAFGGLVAVSWLGNRDSFGGIIGSIALSTLILGALYLLLPTVWTQPHRPLLRWSIAALLVFELFTVNMDADAVYDPIPPTQQLSLTPPPLIQPVLADTSDLPFRVDGFRGITDNYGSLYGIMDLRGISPLFIGSLYSLIEPDKINPPAWELFAVRYVYTDWEELPIPSEIVAAGEDRFGAVNLHRLSDPRPFALLLTDYVVVENDAAAHNLLRQPGFNPRTTVILSQPPDIEIRGDVDDATAAVTAFAPERFTIAVNAPASAILSVSHPDYPGWTAAIDGEPTPILRAYGGLSALVIPAGEHSVTFTYDPLSYRIGAIISLFTWAILVILAAIRIRRL